MTDIEGMTQHKTPDFLTWLADHDRRHVKKKPAPAPTKTTKPSTPPATPPTGTGGSTGGGTTTPPVVVGKWKQAQKLEFLVDAAAGHVFGPTGAYPTMGRYVSGASTYDRGTWATDEITIVANGILSMRLKGTKGGAIAPFGWTGTTAYKIEMVFRKTIVHEPAFTTSVVNGVAQKHYTAAGHHNVPLTWPDADATSSAGNWVYGEGDICECDCLPGVKPAVYLHDTTGNPSRNAGYHPWTTDIFDEQWHTLTVEYDPAVGWTVSLDAETYSYTASDAHPTHPFHFVDQQEAMGGSLPIDPLAETLHEVRSYTLWHLA